MCIYLIYIYLKACSRKKNRNNKKKLLARPDEKETNEKTLLPRPTEKKRTRNPTYILPRPAEKRTNPLPRPAKNRTNDRTNLGLAYCPAPPQKETSKHERDKTSERFRASIMLAIISA